MTDKLAINRWAEEDRPREKMMNKGAQALSNAELLAILIGSDRGPEELETGNGVRPNERTAWRTCPCGPVGTVGGRELPRRRRLGQRPRHSVLRPFPNE